MRVLITGAAGFAGRHLAERCAAEGLEVVGAGRRSAEDADPPMADILAGLARFAIEQRTNPDLLRPNDLVDMRASTEKLTGATRWGPRITLADALDRWRAEVAG